MVLSKAIVIAVFAVFACLAVAGADLITVDGDLTDAGWSGPGVFSGYSPDNVSITDPYDIKYTRNVWDANSGFTFFNMETWAQLTAPTSSNFVSLMIDADQNTGTGVSHLGTDGADYLFEFDLSYGLPGSLQYGSNITGSDNFAFYEWNGTNWVLMSNASNDFIVSRGTAHGAWGVEWGIRGSAMGSPDLFTWGVFLDDGGIQPDDYVMGQTGQAPEPTTLALFALGAAGIYLRRRYG